MLLNHKDRKSMKQTYFMMCLLIALIILISFLAQLFIMRRSLFINTEGLLKAAHQQSYDNIQQYFDSIEDVTNSFAYNAPVQHFLKETDTVKRLNLFPDVQTGFAGLSMSQRDVLGFAIYDKDGYFIVANGLNYQSIIQADSINIKKSISYSIFHSSNPYIGVTVPYYTMTIPVLNSNSMIISSNQIGAIVFTMNQSFIKNQIDAGNALKGCKMMLMDKNGTAIAGFSENVPTGAARPNGQAFIMLESVFPNNGWRLVTYLEKGVIADNMEPLLLMVIVTSIIIITLFISFIVLLSRQLLYPINHISHFMREVSRSKAENSLEAVSQYHLPDKWNYDELSSMTNAMNGMLQSLSEKTQALLNKEKQYYEAVLSRNRMEVLAYRNQINPHFLYNTFECIKGIAFSRNAPEIVEISQALSQMFRYAVKGNNFVTLKEELNHMQEYALIIRYRFMGRITIHIDSPYKANSFYVPRLILQPIVENAVFHGLEKQMGPGSIEVTVSLEENSLRLRVEDNGIGMDARKLAQVTASLETLDSDNGIGLSNIAHRLKLLYTNNNEIRISSSEGTGTRVELILPVLKEVPCNVPGNYSG